MQSTSSSSSPACLRQNSIDLIGKMFSVLVSQQPFLFHIALDYAIPQQARSWIDPPK